MARHRRLCVGKMMVWRIVADASGAGNFAQRAGPAALFKHQLAHCHFERSAQTALMGARSPRRWFGPGHRHGLDFYVDTVNKGPMLTAAT